MLAGWMKLAAPPRLTVGRREIGAAPLKPVTFSVPLVKLTGVLALLAVLMTNVPPTHVDGLGGRNAVEPSWETSNVPPSMLTFG